MGKTFVYNTGEAEVEKKHLEVTFGVFIDGTLNNKENTKLRLKVEGKIDPLQEKGEIQRPATAAEKKTYHNATDTNAFGDWVKRQFDLGGYGPSSSYTNDYTNVARMWFCTQEKYRAYIEGMGTNDFVEDVGDGYAFGSGLTGIRGKVRKACEKLAEKIVNEIKKDKSKTLTKITVDVFGFSRGAASARNMVYEIRKSAYPSINGSIPDGYYPPNIYSEGMPVPKFKQAQVDHDGLEIDSSMLVDGKLPKYGYLGYCLLKKISIEKLEEIQIAVRVLGIYDTVSSYYEAGDSLGTYEQDGTVVDENLYWKAFKKKARGLNPIRDANPFSNNEKQLHLHNLGSIYKAIHFTAADEHRVNFSLTRMKTGIEKNFPGVHCDIGGAYETGEEKKIKLAEERISILKSVLAIIAGLKILRKQLIKEYWFDKDQIWISSTLTKVTLTTKRLVKKEYSYIPLQFMEEYCRKTSMDNFFSDQTEIKFSIKDHEYLVQAKDYLTPYVMNEHDKEWKFLSDEELEEKRKKREEKNRQETIHRKAEEHLKNPHMEKSIFDSLNPNDYKPDVLEMEKEATVAEIAPEGSEDNPIELEEVVIVKDSPQKVLRILRNQYLHWSADHAGIGLEGRSDRKREEFPKL
jgi:hypothetical protein